MTRQVFEIRGILRGLCVIGGLCLIYEILVFLYELLVAGYTFAAVAQALSSFRLRILFLLLIRLLKDGVKCDTGFILVCFQTVLDRLLNGIPLQGVEIVVCIYDVVLIRDDRVIITAERVEILVQ